MVWGRQGRRRRWYRWRLPSLPTNLLFFFFPSSPPWTPRPPCACAAAIAAVFAAAPGVAGALHVPPSGATHRITPPRQAGRPSSSPPSSCRVLPLLHCRQRRSLLPPFSLPPTPTHHPPPHPPPHPPHRHLPSRPLSGTWPSQLLAHGGTPPSAGVSRAAPSSAELVLFGRLLLFFSSWRWGTTRKPTRPRHPAPIIALSSPPLGKPRLAQRDSLPPPPFLPPGVPSPALGPHPLSRLQCWLYRVFFLAVVEVPYPPRHPPPPRLGTPSSRYIPGREPGLTP